MILGRAMKWIPLVLVYAANNSPGFIKQYILQSISNDEVNGLCLSIEEGFNGTDIDDILGSVDKKVAESVKKLDLSRKRLKTIPKNIQRFINLEVLDLSDNKLTEIDNIVLESLSKLKTLYLNGNNLLGLPDNIGKLEQVFIGIYLDLNRTYEHEERWRMQVHS